MVTLGGTRTDLEADDSCTTDAPTDLIARDIAHLDIPFEVSFAEVTSTHPTGESVASFTLPCPDYMGGFYVYGVIEGYVDAGTGSWKLVNDTDTLSGTWRDITNVGAYAETTADKVQIAAGCDVTAPKTIQIWAKVDNPNTVTLRCQLGLTFWFWTS